MHRSHTSFGHVADFGSTGLQELYNLRVAGGLNNINARVGDFDLGFDLFVDVKKRILRWGLDDHLRVSALRQSSDHHRYMRDDRRPDRGVLGGGKSGDAIGKIGDTAFNLHMLLENRSEIRDFGFGGVCAIQAGHGLLIMHIALHPSFRSRARCAVMHCVHGGVGI